MPASQLATQFQQQGFVHLPGLLSSAEVRTYRAALEATSRKSAAKEHARRSWTLPDGVSRTRAFWPLTIHPQVVQAARSILGSDAKYLKHTDLHVGFSGGGWHRDSAHRTFGVGSDWQEEDCRYQILRVGLYLQSYAESGFALGLVPGSHQHESRLTRLELAWPPARWLNKQVLRLRLLTAPVKWIRTEPGDAIVFDPRVLHTGSHIRGEKFGIFMAYGIENRHAREHFNYYHQTRPDLGYEPLEAELAGALELHNLLPQMLRSPRHKAA